MLIPTSICRFEEYINSWNLFEERKWKKDVLQWSGIEQSAVTWKAEMLLASIQPIYRQLLSSNKLFKLFPWNTFLWHDTFFFTSSIQ